MNRQAPTWLLVAMVVAAVLAAVIVARVARYQDRLPGPPTGLRIVPTERAGQ